MARVEVKSSKTEIFPFSRLYHYLGSWSYYTHTLFVVKSQKCQDSEISNLTAHATQNWWKLPLISALSQVYEKSVFCLILILASLSLSSKYFLSCLATQSNKKWRKTTKKRTHTHENKYTSKAHLTSQTQRNTKQNKGKQCNRAQDCKLWNHNKYVLFVAYSRRSCLGSVFK